MLVHIHMEAFEGAKKLKNLEFKTNLAKIVLILSRSLSLISTYNASRDFRKLRGSMGPRAQTDSDQPGPVVPGLRTLE